VTLEKLVNEALRQELLAMRAEDLRIREELLKNGELGKGYAPRMEAVHRRNASRLREIVAEHGWPDCEQVGTDGATAAWFIAQHAIGEPGFQRQALTWIQAKVRHGALPPAHEAYLFDRIAMYEGRPQRYGTQSLPYPDGQYRRWRTENPEKLNERRVAIGMPPLGDDPIEAEPTADALAQYHEWLHDYENWLQRTGWRQD
jgi:hypothetical protein